MPFRAWLAAAAAALVTACGSEQEPAPQPNVLVIVVDCLRADRVAEQSEGSDLTPNLNRLAGDGIRFRNAFAPATWTKPSIASLFTGLYPAQHGLQRVAFEHGEQLSTDALPDQLDTLAERFRRAGYVTGAVINQVHLHSRFGFAQGFEHFTGLRGKPAGKLNQRLLEWLADLEGERPFLAYLHYLDAHWPYSSGEAGPRLEQWQLSAPPPHRGTRAHDWIDGLGPQTRAEAAEELAQLYDEEIRFVDTRLGELLRGLEELGVYDNTVILVTSDHGEGFDEHGRLQHGYAPYEEVIHIPLIVRLPGDDQAGRIVAEAVSLVDVFPTLTELVDITSPASVAGRSLVPLWQLGSERWPTRMLFAEGAETIAVRSERFKLIFGPDGSEYYDLVADPHERQPVDHLQCAGCSELDDALRAYQSAAPTVSTGAVSLTGEEIEDLKDLGYL